jgi:ABC-2 type transport system permease protein
MDLLVCKANTRFIAALVRTSLRSAVALRGTFLIELTFMALNNLVFFSFWWALFLKVPNIRGHRLSDVALLYGIVAISYGLHVVIAGGAREIGRLVIEGELDPFLTLPKPTLLAVLGSQAQASGLGDILSGIGLILGFGEVALQQIPLLLLVSVASSLVLTATVTLFWCTTFWLGRVEALVRQLFEMLLSFSLYPERLFGGALKWALFTLIPAGFVGYFPVRIVSAPTAAATVALLGAVVAYACLANWVFGLGLRRYASGSRFGVHG